LLFGYLVQRTRSLLGVSLAHGFTNISMYLVYPFIVVGGFFSSQPSRPPHELLILPATSIPLLQQTPALILFVTPTSSPQISQTIPSVLSPSAAVTTLTPTITPSPPPVGTGAPTLSCVIPQGWVVYIVRSGDTLYGISLMFRITVSQLQNANCLTSTVIHSGQSLYVPSVPTSTPFFTTETPIPSSTSVMDTDTPIPFTPTDTPLPPTGTDTDTPTLPVPTDTPLPTITDTPSA